jgi:hypothetical protein
MGSSICLNCSTSACAIAELQQQLADARLLARAYMPKFTPNTVMTVGRKWFDNVAFDPSGLPILTDELRAELQKAVGE